MVSEKSRILLEDFGRSVGVELTFDEHGMCFLMVDDMMLSIRALADHFVLYGMLGQFSELPGNGVLKTLLSLNKTLVESDRGAIGFDEDSDAVLLMRPVPSRETTPQLFAKIVGDFVDQLKNLIDLLNEEVPDPGIPDERSPTPEFFPAA